VKATLEFNLPEDNEHFKLANNALAMSIVLEDFDNWLRNKAKYEEQETVTIAEAREILRHMMAEYDL